MKLPIRPRLCLLALLLPAAACGSGGQGYLLDGDAAPSVGWAAPLAAVEIAPGGSVELRWTADDPDSQATSRLVAVGLDVASAIPLVTGVSEQDGAELSFEWSPPPGTEGTYRIDAFVDDGSTEVVASAPGTVRVGAPEAALAGAAALSEGGDIGTLAVFEDGSFVTTGMVSAASGPVHFGSGGPNATTLTSAAEAAYVAKYSSAGEFLWVARTDVGQPAAAFSGGGLDARSIPWDVVPLGDGGCIVDYGFHGVLTVGLGEAQEATYATPSDEPRELLVAYDAAGSVRWSRLAYDSFDAFAGSGPGALALAGPDVLVMTATKQGELVFDLAGADMTVLEDTDAENYVAAFTTDGEFVFASHVVDDPLSEFELVRLVADADGFWLAGTFADTVTFGAGGPNEATLTPTSEFYGLFLAHFDLGGSLRWVRHVGGVVPDEEGDADNLWVNGLQVGTNGETWLLTSTMVDGTYVFDPGGPSELTVSPSEDHAAIGLARFDAGGELDWFLPMTSTNWVGGSDEVFLDGLAALPGGDVGLATLFEGQLLGLGDVPIDSELAPGLGSILVARVGLDGGVVWALNDGGDGGEPELRGLVALPSGSLLVYGSISAYDDPLVLGTNGAEPEILVPLGESSVFGAVYDAAGDF